METEMETTIMGLCRVLDMSPWRVIWATVKIRITKRPLRVDMGVPLVV